MPTTQAYPAPQVSMTTDREVNATEQLKQQDGMYITVGRIPVDKCWLLCFHLIRVENATNSLLR